MKFSRIWGMPNSDTFDVPPIGKFVKSYLATSQISVDPFAGNKSWATHTNDLNPATSAQYHLDAEAFLEMKAGQKQLYDLGIFDPPYSPRQMSECYKSVGREVGKEGTQNGALYKRVRDALLSVLTPEALVLSFGWNSAGMGEKRGFEILEIFLVAHGGGHNDTICVAERRIARTNRDAI